MKSKFSMRRAMIAGVLATGLFSNSSAEDKTLEDIGTKVAESCAKHTAELQQEKGKIAQVAQSPTTSPEQKAQAAKATAELDKVITAMTTLAHDPGLKTSAEKQHEIMAQVRSAVTYGNEVAT